MQKIFNIVYLLQLIMKLCYKLLKDSFIIKTNGHIFLLKTRRLLMWFLLIFQKTVKMTIHFSRLLLQLKRLLFVIGNLWSQMLWNRCGHFCYATLLITSPYRLFVIHFYFVSNSLLHIIHKYIQRNNGSLYDIQSHI